jgi:hypothetical protein
LQAVLNSFYLQDKEEELVVLDLALLTNHSVKRVLRVILQANVVADLQKSSINTSV